MQKDDAETYYYDPIASLYEPDNLFGQGSGYVHKGGLEIDCNLSGRYIHFISSMIEEMNEQY